MTADEPAGRIDGLTPDDRDEVLARLREFWSVWEHGDRALDEAGEIYSDDPDIRIWDGTAVPGPGFGTYGPLLRPFMSQLTSLRNDGVGDVQVLGRGDLAVTVALLRNVGTTADGQDFAETMRETLVWARHGGRWRIIHEHTSPLPEPPDS